MLNVSFYTAEDWTLARTKASQHGLPPQAKPSPDEEYFCGWSTQVGYLYEPGHSHWWGVRDETDAEFVSADVIHVVETYVLPQLTARLARQDPPPEFYDSDHPDMRCEWAYCLANDVDWEDDDN